MPSVGLPFIYGGQPWGLPLPRVVRLLDDFAPELVHAVCPVLLGWAGVLHARGRGVPLVCSYHTHIARYAHHYRLGFAERSVWALVRRAHRQAHVNLAASEASRDELESQGVRNVGVWRGGADLGLFHPRHASTSMRRRLTGGRPERRVCLAAEKGLERLLPLAAPGGGRHLALVADGPARAALEHTFAGAQATFTGPVAGRALAAAYASADVFVFPSTTDTLGLVLLEPWRPVCPSWPPGLPPPPTSWPGPRRERCSTAHVAALPQHLEWLAWLTLRRSAQRSGPVGTPT